MQVDSEDLQAKEHGTMDSLMKRIPRTESVMWGKKNGSLAFSANTTGSLPRLLVMGKQNVE